MWGRGMNNNYSLSIIGSLSAKGYIKSPWWGNHLKMVPPGLKPLKRLQPHPFLRKGEAMFAFGKRPSPPATLT
jgi:hypothetical protein